MATPVATSVPSNASNASSKPTNLDDLDTWKHLRAPCKVEGLVDFLVRGGSSLVGRTGKAPLLPGGRT